MEAPMNDMSHIRTTVHKIGRQLEKLVGKEITVSRGFDILARKAQSIEEMVVIEVMREVYSELELNLATEPAYADSSTRSARMPAMALSR
jgi:hypothetical protein